jgi:endoglucanase
MTGLPEPSAKKLPRWRGFNLLEKFTNARGNRPFVEDDFRWIADWGFDFVRLPMDYRTWTSPDDWRRFNEGCLREIDVAVGYGRKHGLHVNLNFHRGPGYCVNPPKEAKDLWTDPEALEVFCLHWATFARRYRDRPNRELSFDLINEPANVENPQYARIATAAVEAIRREDPHRLVISDGTQWGNRPVHELAGLGVGQSTRGYAPMWISHHQANWAGWNETWPRPAWPQEGWDRARLWKEQIEPWQALEAKGVGVHVGEWGAFNKTPHGAVLAWAEDCLANWRAADWGWAMWEFRGAFGILDSGRTDVAYEDCRGHQLDRALLDLLRKY